MRVKVQTKKGHEVVDINRRKAIRLRCLNCSGYSYKDVENCQFEDCDLYPFRMGTAKQDAKKRHKAIRSYCQNCCNGDHYELCNCPCTDCPLYAYRISRIDNSVNLDQN